MKLKKKVKNDSIKRRKKRLKGGSFFQKKKQRAQPNMSTLKPLDSTPYLA
jgi:hypothetical protein